VPVQDILFSAGLYPPLACSNAHAYMLTIKTSDIDPVKLYGYLNHAIAPRPICFVSTIDAGGNANLSPFSFFNMVSTNPPVCVFSATNTGDNLPKHSLQNVQQVAECVINVVSYSMVQQMNLASAQFDRGVNEFVKAGFIELPSELVRPPRVAAAPVQMECVVTQIIPLGNLPNSGNMVIAEIKMVHIDEAVLDENGRMDQMKLDLVGRLGADWYCRTNETSLFKVRRPVKSIGIDDLPEHVRQSTILTGNDLGMLANIEHLPNGVEVNAYLNTQGNDPTADIDSLHKQAKHLIGAGKVHEARLLLLSAVSH
jgi:flavin reductase (DIM6/NTAB) family NADH-FMN oxidoreductase RutF